ncbi:MAG: radical SAM protein [Calditrichaeota bacterium]|nr:MAG: radical SAM protein [Calditrichota bacterium]
MKRHVLLINPWITDFAAYDFWLKPLGLLYIAAVLKAREYEVTLIDCLDRYDSELLEFQGLAKPKNRYFSTGKFHREIIPKPAAYRHVPRNYARYGLPLPLFRQKLKRTRRPDAVLVTSGMTYWYPGVQQTIAEVRKRFPDVPVVLGGIYATLCRQHAAEHSGADIVVSGEGELPALRAVDALVGTRRSYAGLYRTLDALPFPAFDLYGRLGSVPLMTSRGCPLNCTFCASRIVSGTYRWRDPRAVVAEIEWDLKRHGVREIAFYDDALLTNHRNHLQIILDEVVRRGWRLCFHTPNGLQCKLIEAEVAQLMRRAGFQTIRLSYESGNPARRRDMSNKVSDEHFGRAVRILFAAGFVKGQLDAYVMMALPGQSIEEVLRSMAFVHSHGVKVRLAAFSPIPGTVDWRRAIERGTLHADDDPLLTNNSIVPVRPAGTTFHTFEKLSLLAKKLNADLHETGAAVGAHDLLPALKSEFSRDELRGGIESVFPLSLRPGFSSRHGFDKIET